MLAPFVDTIYLIYLNTQLMAGRDYDFIKAPHELVSGFNRKLFKSDITKNSYGNSDCDLTTFCLDYQGLAYHAWFNFFTG